jgi:phosphatidylserine/phosphatidylglycerophosphate/cardiolipin synthase-like enzyme
LLFERLARLGTYDRFTLAGMASPDARGNRRDIYVHAKIMLIDDEWATISSSNRDANSLSDHTEMNASIWDGAVVRPLRCALLAELLNLNTADLGTRAALQRRKIARSAVAREPAALPAAERREPPCENERPCMIPNTVILGAHSISSTLRTTAFTGRLAAIGKPTMLRMRPVRRYA